MTRAEFIAKNQIESVCRENRIQVIGSGKNRMAKCPFHKDQTASMSVNVSDNTWFCHAGCGGGGVIDLLAKIKNQSVIDFIKENNITANDASRKMELPIPAKLAEDCVYSYQNALGAELYQVVRYKPKTFKQRHTDENGNTVWGMEGVERVLYRLPEIYKSQQVFVCFSEDTEVLTPNGWVSFPNLKLTDEIAQYHGGWISFVKPSRIQKFRFSGSAVNFKSRWCDTLVTPDHPMLVKKKKKYGLGPPIEIEAQHAHYSYRLPTCGFLIGKDVQLSENQVRIIAAVQADGHYPRGYHIEFNIKKQRKKQRLRMLLMNENIDWVEKEYVEGWTLFVINDRRSIKFLSHLENKHFTWKMLNWPINLREALLDELRHWDGDTVGIRGHRFFTSEKNDSEIVSALGAVTGYSTTLRSVNRQRKNCVTEHVISLTKAEWRTTKNKRVNYDGYVYCCTVPSHAILTRRNGKCLVTKQCEGEKDADNLASLGFAATCNVGGAGKWLDGYTESLIGKDVVICGDNDEPGRKHVQLVFDSLAGKVKTAKIITIPSPHKDVSDYIAATPDAKEKLELMIATATPFVNGIRLPIYSMVEIEPKYRAQIENAKTATLDLSRWLPSLKGRVRRMVPGELVLLLGDTGTGKTALLQNIALHAEPLPTLMFEMELPEELVYERFVAIKTGMTCASVETAHASKEVGSFSDDLSESFKHLFICPESKLSIDTLESLINKAELKMGVKPVVVLIDYIQLIAGQGKRYERVSDAAESLKSIAKSTKTIVIVASQVHRPNYQEGPEIGLHSGKDSGSLENSAGLVVGAWRDDEDSALLHLRVLKNTKGSGCVEVLCNFNGATMQITERSKINEVDIPQPKAYKD